PGDGASGQVRRCGDPCRTGFSRAARAHARPVRARGALCGTRQQSRRCDRLRPDPLVKALIRHRVAAGSDRFPAAMPPLLRRVLLNRSACCDDDVALDMGRMHPPGLLQGLPAAVAILEEELQRQGRILIISDFDADGATSCVLAIRALRAMGFHHVDYIVPNRFEYGYGLTPEIVDLAAARAPDLLVTVDNGISSIEGVAAANARGMRVVITHHQRPGRQLPAAAAIVNPNQPGCDFPSKSLAGVGVIFYLMIALRARLRDSGWFTSQ